MKEEGKQQLARQREAMSLKHQEEIKELKEEHEGEIKVKKLFLYLINSAFL